MPADGNIFGYLVLANYKQQSVEQRLRRIERTSPWLFASIALVADWEPSCASGSSVVRTEVSFEMRIGALTDYQNSIRGRSTIGSRIVPSKGKLLRLWINSEIFYIVSI